jgi:HK97 family phage major capsid protein
LLAKVKKATGSNEPLLSIGGPTEPTSRQILGVPLYVSTAVTAGTIWGIPRARSLVIVRQGTTVELDGSAYFSSDRSAIRAILRVGLGWTAPLSVVKISLTA